MNRVLAIFDFDGTLTVKDSMIDFLKRRNGPLSFYLNLLLLSPVLVLFKLGLVVNWRAKELMLSRFFKGMSESQFQAMCDSYSRDRIPQILRDEALKRLDYHKQHHHDVVVVSASPENWLKIWCSDNEISLIATQLEVKSGRMTGKINGRNCYGPEKVVRIKENYKIQEYDEIYAYGDSRGDREMLEMSDKPFYRRFS